MTVIHKANELISEQGKEAAIKYFQDKIDDLGKSRDFSELCKISGFETAIDYINSDKYIKTESK